jgi:hypothetical protein
VIPRIVTLVAISMAVGLAGCSAPSQQVDQTNQDETSSANAEATSATQVGASTDVCTVRDSRLTELSGITTSIAHPGTLWTHNDSGGGSVIYALDDSTCEVQAVITLDGVDLVDPEAIAVGRDANGEPIIWVADIGGNTVRRSNVWLHSLAEPKELKDQRVTVSSSAITYSDGPGDSEALLVEPTPGGRMWIVSKRQSSVGKFYALPAGFGPGSTSARVTPVGSAPWLTTDAAFAPNGEGFVLRTYLSVRRYQGPAPGTNERIVEVPQQGQGEALTYTPDSCALLTIPEGENPTLQKTVIC